MIIRRYQSSFKLISPDYNNFTSPFIAFELHLVPKCRKDEFHKSVELMIKPVFLEHEYLDLQISLIRPKYMTKEKAPIIVIRNKEVDV